MVDRRKSRLAAACALALMLSVLPAGSAARAQAPPGCEAATLAYLALLAQRATDRRRYLRCLADRRQDCRAELEQFRTTEYQLRLLGAYLRGCTR